MNNINQFWTGTAGNDVYTGDQSDEFLDGWTGNDILAGGLGDDFILGGDGFDAAKFSGDLDDYLFSRSEDGENLVVFGADGRDTLSGVESVIFDDMTFPIANYSDQLRTIHYGNPAGILPALPISDLITLSNGRTVQLKYYTDNYYPGYSSTVVNAQIYDSNGFTLGDEFRVGSLSTGRDTIYSGGVELLAWPDGTWIAEVTFSGNAVPTYRQRHFDNDGNEIGHFGQLTHPPMIGGTPPPIDYAVKITGASTETQSLSVDTSLLVEKFPHASLNYQWRREGIAIEDADDSTFALGQDDVGSSISVTVSLIDESGNEQSFTSDFTSLVENSNDLPEGSVSMSGALEVGSVLTVDAANLSDADGLGPLSYQWLRDGADIEGESRSSYTLGIADIGSEITIRASYTDGYGTLETVTSAASGVVLPDPDTRIAGSDGADWLAGTDAGQLIEGLAGNDTILGGGGADFLQGGAGDDLLSGEGTLAASFGLTIANQVYRFYQSALDRTPDAAGHAAWSERIASAEMTLLEVAESFVRSPEFTQTYANLSNSEFVELLYNNVLNRASDSMGLNSWTERLEQGATRAELLVGFSQSPEFVSSTTEQASNFAMDDTASEWADEVYRLYNATLYREPDIGGLQGWSMRLGNAEITLIEATNGFIQSREFQNVYSDLTNAEFVTLLYQNVLNRDPDAGGLARWIEQLDDGASRAQIVLGFSESPQFKANSTPSLEQWMRNKGADDILYAGSGDNTLYGGILSDTFVFDVASGGSHRVMDLEKWDTLDFRGFGYTSDDDIRQHMTQVVDDVVFSDQNLNATFVGYELTSVSDVMLL